MSSRSCRALPPGQRPQSTHHDHICRIPSRHAYIRPIECRRRSVDIRCRNAPRRPAFAHQSLHLCGFGPLHSANSPAVQGIHGWSGGLPKRCEPFNAHRNVVVAVQSKTFLAHHRGGQLLRLPRIPAPRRRPKNALPSVESHGPMTNSRTATHGKRPYFGLIHYSSAINTSPPRN